MYGIEFKKALEKSIQKYSTEFEVFHFLLLISSFDLSISRMPSNLVFKSTDVTQPLNKAITASLLISGSDEFFLISNFRPVLNVVCFLLGNFLASEIYMPTFRSNVSVPPS